MTAMAAACAIAAMPASSRDAGGAAPLVVLTAGRMNVKHPDEGPSAVGVEYRWAPIGPWRLVPGAGLTLAEEGAAYAYAALHRDFRLGRSWFLTPTFGAGAFRNGGNLDLGYALEFRTGLELSFQLADRYRLGLLGYHISNASLSDSNPGTEVVEFVFAIPLGGD
jgi:lipid A 3-O-deacylase